MFFNNNIFLKNQDYILKINDRKEEKTKELFEIINEKNIDIKPYKNIKFITDCVMKNFKKSDKIFLLWLYFFGEHINLNFGSKWALLKYDAPFLSEFYYPVLIDKKEEIWFVGTDCARAYFKYNKLNQIDFSGFYKVTAERIIYSPNLKDIQGKLKDFIVLD
ncbi:MAG: hypothetical protein V3V28_02340 [Polaribacter sp.]|uniref:hypothetical protein n=1 Tax=Polaribacter sp. TaxID=1920175 RepID=UPI002F352671